MRRIERHPDDHPIKTLRGRLKSDGTMKLRAIVNRIAWLEYRTARREPEGLPIFWETTELQALWEMLDGRMSLSADEMGDEFLAEIEAARQRIEGWERG